MPNNHSQVYNLSTDGEFRARFAAALAAYVSVVVDEASTVPNHAERMSLALKVLDDPQSYANKLALGAAAKLGGVMPADAGFDALVAGYWTLLAVASAAEAAASSPTPTPIPVRVVP